MSGELADDGPDLIDLDLYRVGDTDRYELPNGAVVEGRDAALRALGMDEGEEEDGPRNRYLSATVTLFDLWETVLNGYREDRVHASKAYLRTLTRATGGVPDFARSYVDGLESGEIARGRGRPAVYLEPAEITYMADLDMLPDLPLRQRGALAYVSRLHWRLERYETRSWRVGSPGSRFRWLTFHTRNDAVRGIPLQHYPGRGVWKIQKPKVQAYRLAGLRFGRSRHTVEDWERRDRAYIPSRRTPPAGPLQAP